MTAYLGCSIELNAKYLVKLLSRFWTPRFGFAFAMDEIKIVIGNVILKDFSIFLYNSNLFDCNLMNSPKML